MPAPPCWRRAHGRGRFSPQWVQAAQLPVLVEAAAVPLWPGSHGDGRKPNTSKIAPPSESPAPGARTYHRDTERHHARPLLHPAGATWAGSEPKRPGRHTNVLVKEAAASSARRLEVRNEAKGGHTGNTGRRRGYGPAGRIRVARSAERAQRLALTSGAGGRSAAEDRRRHKAAGGGNVGR
ncbi:unnamed protein product [Ixodes persulcatus]